MTIFLRLAREMTSPFFSFVDVVVQMALFGRAHCNLRGLKQSSRYQEGRR